MSIDLEQNHIGETIGIQDQCASSFGGFVHINAYKNNIQANILMSQFHETIGLPCQNSKCLSSRYW